MKDLLSRYPIYLLMLLASLTFLSSCGESGPLYLPNKESKSAQQIYPSPK